MRATLLLLTVVWTAGCARPSANRPSTRAYRLGFSATPPRLELASVLQTIEQWTGHGDAALVSLQPPWRSLLADTSAAFLVRRDQAELVALYRRKRLPVGSRLGATAAPLTEATAEPSFLPRLYRFGRNYRFATKAQCDFHEERREGGSVRLAISQLGCVALDQR